MSERRGITPEYARSTGDDLEIRVRVRAANLPVLEEGVELGIDALTMRPIVLRPSGVTTTSTSRWASPTRSRWRCLLTRSTRRSSRDLPDPPRRSQAPPVASLPAPDQVVHPNHAYEWADGTESLSEQAPRGCLCILMFRASERAAVGYPELRGLLVQDTFGHANFTRALREYGGPGCADRIEAAKP